MDGHGQPALLYIVPFTLGKYKIQWWHVGLQSFTFHSSLSIHKNGSLVTLQPILLAFKVLLLKSCQLVSLHFWAKTKWKRNHVIIWVFGDCKRPITQPSAFIWACGFLWTLVFNQAESHPVFHVFNLSYLACSSDFSAKFHMWVGQWNKDDFIENWILTLCSMNTEIDTGHNTNTDTLTRVVSKI